MLSNVFVNVSDPCRPVLQSDVYNRNNRWLFGVHLMVISATEASLTEGRFARFSPARLDHPLPVRERFEGAEQRWAWFTQRITWIAAQTVARWSLYVVVNETCSGDLSVEFSFEDADDRLDFLLACWQGDGWAQLQDAVDWGK